MRFCPVLLYKLYQLGIFLFDDIKTFLENRDAFILSYYYHKEIDNFDDHIRLKTIPSDYDDCYYEFKENIDALIQYGFAPNTIEYCLKYDDINAFINIYSNQNHSPGGIAKWSPFEWSQKPDFFDFLSFYGFYGSIECFKYLLMNGFSIDDKIRSIVVCSGNTDLFHICNNVIVDFSNHICYAAEYFRLSILNFLIEKGVNINCINRENSSPLHLASKNGHIGLVEFFIKQGADLDKKDSNCMTPLFYAANNFHLHVVDYLIRNGADINAKDEDGWTPLHYAARYDSYNVLEYLVKHGADINAKDTSNVTPLHYASRVGNLKIVEYLVNHKAVLNAQDEEHETPLHYSCKKDIFVLLNILSNKELILTQEIMKI